MRWGGKLRLELSYAESRYARINAKTGAGLLNISRVGKRTH